MKILIIDMDAAENGLGFTVGDYSITVVHPDFKKWYRLRGNNYDVVLLKGITVTGLVARNKDLFGVANRCTQTLGGKFVECKSFMELSNEREARGDTEEDYSSTVIDNGRSSFGYKD